MSHIVMLTGTYYPYFSACSNCINNVAQILKKDHHVTVIASKNDFKLKKRDSYEGIEIIRVSDRFDCFHKWCVDHMKTAKSKPLKTVFYLLLQGKRVLYTLKNLCRRQSLNPLSVRSYMRELEDIDKKEEIDILIPASAPHETIFAAIRFLAKKPSVCVIPFQLDHFSDTLGIYKFKFVKRLRYHRHIALEKEVLEKCEHLFILPHLKDHYDSEEFRKYAGKITIAEHPLLKKKEIGVSNEKNVQGKRVNLVYAGSLDTRLRNPEYFLKALEHAPDRDSLCANLFTMGNCGTIIEKYQKILRDALQNHGSVPLKAAFEAMAGADILLSIGNNAPNEIPSKLFDYLSFGKPIIHFYYLDTDAYLHYLEPYPFSLCLKMDDSLLEQNAVWFSEFCMRIAGKQISYENVSRIYDYATPEYVTVQICEYFPYHSPAC